MIECKEVISSTNYDLKFESQYYSGLFIYCKNNYCCNPYSGHSMFYRCPHKKFCCANYKHCERLQTTTNHRTPVYNPKNDVWLRFFGPTFAIGIVVVLAVILRKVFLLASTNENAERAADDQSDDVYALPTYSRVCFDNRNTSIDMQFGGNQQTDDRISNDEDVLPSYESLKILPPPYSKE